MKRFKFLYLLIFISSSNNYSQNIVDFFHMVPDDYFVSSNPNYKKELIQNGEYNYDGALQTISIDKANGFLSIYTHYSSSFVRFEMCYWNYDSKKLVAISQYGGNPRTFNFFQSEFVFFIFSEGKLVKTEQPIFKNYYPNLDITIDLLKSEFYNDKPRKFVIEYEKLNPSMIFYLPKKGKDIIIEYDNQKVEEDFNCCFEPQKIVLKWLGNGYFE